MPHWVAKRVVMVAVVAALAAAPSIAGDTPAKPTGKCMMWTAKSKTATVYLVGSLHTGRPEMYPLPKEMEDTFAKADLLVEEIKESKDDDKLFDEDYFNKTQYAGSDTLRGHVTADQWEQVKSACEFVGLQTEIAEKTKPAPLSLALTYFAGKKAGKPGGVGPPGIDDYFSAAADKRHMPVEAFETFEFQMKLLTFGMPDKVAVRELMREVARIKGAPADKDETVPAWLSGDTDAAAKWVAKVAAFDPGWARHLLFDRNSRMADKVEQYLEGTKTVFVVVGCLHVVGDRGIVQLLRDDGYAVEQSSATRPHAALTP